MESIEVTYPFCKFGFEYAFKQRDKNITEWRRAQNMHSFDANIVTILWEERVQTIRFTVCVCICMYARIYIYMWPRLRIHFRDINL
jgi:hypothetical protein